MRLSIFLRFAALAVLLGLAAFSVPAQDQSSDDVAAAARRAKEQQKNAPPPKKVFTNDDMPGAKNAPADATAAKTEGQKDSGNSDKGEDANSEAGWRKRFQKQRDKIADAEKELDILQRELEKSQVQYYPDPQKAMQQQYDRSEINQKSAKIDAKKKEIEGLKQQLADMEDELRKSGGDPGWAR